jgi:thioredoxin 1
MQIAGVVLGLGAVVVALGAMAYLASHSDPAGQAMIAGQTNDAVQLTLRAGKPTVAEFGANACASCREMKPILQALQRDHGERVAVVIIDLLAQKEAPYIDRYRIQLMPTQVFFDSQGRETSRHMGKISGDEILQRLGQAAP